jgi:hypothetical protein
MKEDAVRHFVYLMLAAAGVAGAAETDCLCRDRFVVLSASQAQAAQLLECPNHAFGGMQDGINEIGRRKATLPGGEISFVQFCITDQTEAIARCAPLVDLAAVNPYVTMSDAGPSPDTAIWPDCNHPLLNRLRQLVAAAGDVPLLARIGIGGDESRYLTVREPTFEELEWMVVAAVGAGFRGIVWVGEFDTGGRLRSLGNGLERFAEDLGKAKPVRWVVTPAELPVSVLATDSRLVVVLLSPAYFQDPKVGRVQKLPIDPPLQKGTLTLRLPDRIAIKAGVSLHGRPVVPQRQAGNTYNLLYQFAGGGTVLFLDLVQTDPPASEAGRETP